MSRSQRSTSIICPICQGASNKEALESSCLCGTHKIMRKTALGITEKESKPFRCPNCYGTGIFRDREEERDEYSDCHSCQGKGIVWRE